MIWVDREVKKIVERNFKLEWVDDMKTPSGPIHVGALRGMIIHDLIYKVLLENERKAKFTWIFEDHDQMDAIPSYLDFNIWEKYAGMQLYKIPSPEPGYESYAKYYAIKFQEVFEQLNCHPEIIWGSELYNSGKMNGVIREALDKASEIRKIYFEFYKNKKPDSWYPFMAVCQHCQKVGTTQVYKWDGKFVYYKCHPEIVAWAKGCEYEGKVSPFDGNGKLPWKVEWPAKWKALGITIEGAGKDHMSKGGSHDVAKEFCKRVFDYPVPYPLAYEFFIAGGRKMSSSKGIGTSAIEVSKILPPELLRFLIVRTPINTSIDFDPRGDTILNLFDEYDKCMMAHFDGEEGIITEGKPGEVKQDFARIIELSQVRPLPEKRPYLPRFRTVVHLIKGGSDVLAFFESQKGKPLNQDEKEFLEERVVFAQVYLKSYAQDEEKISFVSSKKVHVAISDEQKQFFKALIEVLEKNKSANREVIQTAFFDLLKSKNSAPKKIFPLLYQMLIGKSAGPKIADLIIQFGVEKVTNRLKEVIK